MIRGFPGGDGWQRIVGLDIEIASLVAQKLNKKL
jgi:hypothetical protein